MSNALHDLQPDPGLRKRHFLSSLAAHVGATAAVCIISPIIAPFSRPSPLPVVIHSNTPLELLEQYYMTGLPRDPALTVLRKRLDKSTQSVLTCTREELVPDDKWLASLHVAEVRNACNLNHCIYSILTLPAMDIIAEVVLMRATKDRRRFTGREAQIVNLAHGESAWIYRNDYPFASPQVLKLTPRQRQTLQYLLSGHSEKQIAGKLRLSHNTVHHYVKALHRHFKVASRAELLALWVRPS